MKTDHSMKEQGKLKVISNFNSLRILHFEFEVKPDNHAYAKLKLLLDSEAEPDLFAYNLKEESIKVVEYKEDGKEVQPPVFAGLILNYSISYEGNSMVADLYAVSGSYLTDTIKRFRSFQNTDVSYRDLAYSIIGNTDKADLLYGTDYCKINNPVIQYEETDFEFLIRLASHQNICIYPDITESVPRIYYGIPKGEDKGELIAIEYKTGSDCCYESGGRSGDAVKRRNKSYYEVVVRDDYKIGDTVWFHNRRLRVMTKKGSLSEGQMYFTYIIAEEAWLWQERRRNPHLSGACLSGKVISAEQEMVKIHLDIDKSQDADNAYSFPWCPGTGNIMYCIPETGNSVYLHIGGWEESNSMAVSCIRRNGNTCPETQNPSDRYLTDKHGQKIKMSPTGVELKGIGENGSKPVVGFNDNGGIHLRTNQNVTIKAAGKVQLNGKKVMITTPKELTIVKKDFLSPTVLKLNNTIDILGAQGTISSRDEKAAEYTEKRERQSEYDISDIREEVLSTVPRGENRMSDLLAGSMVNRLYSSK